MTKKEWTYTFLIIILILSIVAIIIMSFQKYSISDIDADNWKEGIVGNWVHGTDDPIDEVCFDNCIRDNFSVLYAYRYATSNNYEGNGLDIECKNLQNGCQVTIRSKNTGLLYIMVYNRDNRLTRFSFMFAENDESKRIVDNLILKRGFILSKTVYKDRDDIIIKELPDKFIIGDIVGQYENPHFGVVIKAYTKKKYFRF